MVELQDRFFRLGGPTEVWWGAEGKSLGLTSDVVGMLASVNPLSRLYAVQKRPEQSVNSGFSLELEMVLLNHAIFQNYISFSLDEDQ